MAARSLARLAAYGPKRSCWWTSTRTIFTFSSLQEPAGNANSREGYAEVADIRDPGRLAHLGAAYRPQDVFHAAAHKHVPLMEDAPEEAVKNNIFGTLNVALMARCLRVRAAVCPSSRRTRRCTPSSVMGLRNVSRSFLVARDLARRIPHAVHRGPVRNVLRSAGSVAPLFQAANRKRGPVTVTHPDCSRYFTTIPESVNLVLLAGLGQRQRALYPGHGQAVENRGSGLAYDHDGRARGWRGHQNRVHRSSPGRKTDRGVDDRRGGEHLVILRDKIFATQESRPRRSISETSCARSSPIRGEQQPGRHRPDPASIWCRPSRSAHHPVSRPRDLPRARFAERSVLSPRGGDRAAPPCPKRPRQTLSKRKIRARTAVVGVIGLRLCRPPPRAAL